MPNLLGRGLAFLGVAWLAMIVVASLEAVVPLPWASRIAGPEVPLLVVLFVGLQAREGIVGATAIAVLVGYLADLFSGAPKGLHMLALVVVMMVSRAASSRLLVRGWFATSLVTLGFAVGYCLLVAGLRVSLEPEIGWGPLRLIPATAIATALVAPLGFRLLVRVDRRFVRDARLLRVAS